MEEELKCVECGFGNNPDHHYCRRCGAEIEPNFDDADQLIEVEAPPKTASGCGVKVIEAGIVLFCLFVVSLIIISPGTGRRNAGAARQKHCFANMRVLLGAIEMYNMDNSVAIRRVDATTIATLVSGRYLRAPVECPGDSSAAPGIYHSDGDLAVNGHVLCTLHGSIESPAPLDR